MAIKKKYEDSVIVGGKASENLTKVISSLESAGFKKVKQEQPLLRVRGDWKPIIGTLFGDITVDLVDEGNNTKVQITIVANVDNAYSLVSSPGARLKSKFLDEFTKISIAPNGSQPDDIASKLERLQSLKDQGLISAAEYDQARMTIINGI
jgi:hypothetical protein